MGPLTLLNVNNFLSEKPTLCSSNGRYTAELLYLGISPLYSIVFHAFIIKYHLHMLSL